MCNYLKSEQYHSIDLVNFLITSRGMFSIFCDTTSEMHHTLPYLNLDF